MESRKDHWQHIYATKQPEEVSWTQAYPKISLDLIHHLDLPKTASILDAGGGESRLADNLLEEGYTDITVLDISPEALEHSKKRLGERAASVTWIAGDILDFHPARQYDLWHDRALFHFFISPEETAAYRDIVLHGAKNYLLVGTFSDAGPKRCSGLDVRRYSEQDLEDVFAPAFKKVECLHDDHITPFGTAQNFIFCSFERPIV